MKKFLSALLVLLSTSAGAQNISGLYSGTLYNDTTKQTQVYELALSEYRDKITGWAYATFIVNDTFYYSIRRVKGFKKDGALVVEDAEMLANNFPKAPDKGVRRITTIPLQNLSEGDTLGSFSGTWKTTRTKTFYSLPGTMAMQRDNDSTHSALLAHLKELNIIEQPASTAAAQPAIAVSTKGKTKVSEKEKEAVTPKKETTNAVANTTIPYTQRKQQVLQTIEVSSDSLVLSFYDNGVVDGDIISVYINNQNIISNAKLLEVATKKTVSLSSFAGDEIELVLVAETLGSLPPNTGLLQVRDGDKKYEVRFSADLQTNATIVIKKRK